MTMALNSCIYRKDDSYICSIRLRIATIDAGAGASVGRVAGPSNSAALGSAYDSETALMTVMISKILERVQPYFIGVIWSPGRTGTAARR